MAKIFLSAPFETGQHLNRLNTIKTLVEDNGHTCYTPLDNEAIGSGDKNQIFNRHKWALRACDFLLADAEFMNTRIAFEIGVASAERKRIVLYSNNPISEINPILIGMAEGVVQSVAELTSVLNGSNHPNDYDWEGQINIHS